MVVRLVESCPPAHHDDIEHGSAAQWAFEAALWTSHSVWYALLAVIVVASVTCDTRAVAGLMMALAHLVFYMFVLWLHPRVIETSENCQENDYEELYALVSEHILLALYLGILVTSMAWQQFCLNAWLRVRLCSACALWVMGVCWSRYTLGYHSAPEVLLSLVTGAVTSVASLSLVMQWILPAFHRLAHTLEEFHQVAQQKKDDL
jgi:hypothetical protein